MLRILSDLHLHDSTSRVHTCTRLEPLLEGVDTLILNGDTCDTQTGATPAQVAELLEFFRQRVPTVILITGNHDPDIAGPDQYFAAARRIWVTHGDILFPDLNPWSQLRPLLRSRLAARRAMVTAAAWDDLSQRLRHYRAVCLRPPAHFNSQDRAIPVRLHRAITTFFPPTQLWRMIGAWRQCAPRARDLARRHDPTAQVVVVGHTHRPFVSRVEGAPVVINTGSFSRPFGATLVDCRGEHITVRRVRESRGYFHAGKLQTTFSLAPPALAPQSMKP
jgi:predicted phosphodiesterase